MSAVRTYICTFPFLAREFDFSKNLLGPLTGHTGPLAAAGMTTSVAASSTLGRNNPVSWIKQGGAEVMQNPCGKETKVTWKGWSYSATVDSGIGCCLRGVGGLESRC